MLKKALLLLPVIGIAGCAGSQSHLRILEADNALRVEPVEASTHDYLVTLRNVLDFGFDADNPTTRHRTALQMLASQCPAAQIVGESVIETGEYLGGRSSRTYLMQVKCG